MAGRRPKPTHLRLVEGNRGKRPINKKEPKPRREIPSPPAHLSDRAKVAWGYVSAILDRMGVLTEADAVALEGLCEAYADLLEARASLAEAVSVSWQVKDKDGGVAMESAVLAEAGSLRYVTTGKSGPMIRSRPEVALIADADRRMKAWLVEFGLTPAARSKVKSGNGDEEKDPLAEFVG